MAALDDGRDEQALPIVDAALAAAPNAAPLWQAKGLLHRAGEDMQPAILAFRRAAALAPRDARIAHGLAQSLADAGQPAIAAFEAALRIDPGSRDLLAGLTAARLADQGPAAAIAPLAAAMAQQPDWLQGHWLLARIRWLAGERDTFASSLFHAIRAQPRSPSLWAQLIYILVHARLYDQALAVIAHARQAAGAQAAFDLNEAICRSELGQIEAADAIFARQRPATDMATAIQIVRHALRAARPDAAARVAERFADVRRHGPLMIPYLSIVWRLLGDARWAWLEGDDRLIGVHDLDLDPAFIAALADRLRALHALSGEPVEQSLRAGTQTDGALLSRIEPEFRQLRAAFAGAVARHVAQLPPVDPAHPTLGARRDAPVRFAGSWSVRLSHGGFHANHVHPAGWLSSAFYVALPPISAAPASATAGWLTLGEPPAELGVVLPPIRTVQPVPGRLAIFPSTMWHGTEPFPAGERLTSAFDVALPPAR